MALGVLFWLLMLILLVFGFLGAWPRAAEQRMSLGYGIVWWLLLAVLGWAVFGPALRG